ncbi:N-acetylmuramoyl-L-alanine amidase [bacterium]|nr:N-acetylmuramoyl-L-alanine amidase [bacterium]
MKKGIFFVVLTLFLTALSSYAYEIVYPKTVNSATYANASFFIGSVKKNEVLKINGQRVKTASNGAFAHYVKLKDGKNYFQISSEKLRGRFVRDYYITKKVVQPTPKEDLGIIEETEKVYTVVNENSILRSSPADYGMNRISLLPKDTYLLTDGRAGIFYRVKLSPNRYGWIKQSDVVYDEYADETSGGYFKNCSTYNTEEEVVYTAVFSKNLPYEVKTTAAKVVLNVFNVENRQDGVYSATFDKPEFITYSSEMKDGALTLKIKNKDKYIRDNKLRGINIVIDAGHGGNEVGAIGCLGTKEKDVNLRVAKSLKNAMKSLGANIEMTRTGDNTVGLYDRVKFAKENDALIFVSIHFNAIPDGSDPMKSRGTSVYYYNPEAKDLAQAVQNGIVRCTGTKDNGIKTASFAVIRPTEYVGILIECAYMINPEDSVLYTNSKFIEELAEGISEGIQQYISNTGDVYTEIRPIEQKKRKFLWFTLKDKNNL